MQKKKLKNVLITGSSGFIGSCLINNLPDNFVVYALDKKKKKFNRKINFIHGTILSKKNYLKKILNKIDIIFHFAAISDLTEASNLPVETVKTNILSSIELLDMCCNKKIKFIFASTIYVLSEDGGFYKSSKRAVEDYIIEYSKKFNIDFRILRYGSLYGADAPSTNGLKKILIFAKKNKLVYDGKKNSVRRYIHVEDATKAAIKVISSKYKNQILNITGKKEIKITKILNFIKKKFKINSQIFYLKKGYGHYTKNPITYKVNKGKNFFLKNEYNIYSEIEKFLKK